VWGSVTSSLLTAGVTFITVGTSAVAESIIYSVDSHNVGYIRCHRHNIGILTSDSESTSKAGPGDIQYVILRSPKKQVIYCHLLWDISPQNSLCQNTCPRTSWISHINWAVKPCQDPPQMDHPMSYPGPNTNYPGPIQLSLGAHLKNVPIRLNSYEKILSL
jgi:hypothetical protein